METTEEEFEKIVREIQETAGDKVNRVRKQLFGEEHEEEDTQTSKPEKIHKNIHCEIEERGKLTNRGIKCEEKLQDRSEQKWESKEQVTRSRIMEEKMDCISTLDREQKILPNSQVMKKKRTVSQHKTKWTVSQPWKENS